MASRALRWEVLRSPRYLRFAVPGLTLLVVSWVFWGQGWWPHMVQLVGLSLIMWPLPTSSRKRREATPDARSARWTGIR